MGQISKLNFLSQMSCSVDEINAKLAILPSISSAYFKENPSEIECTFSNTVYEDSKTTKQHFLGQVSIKNDQEVLLSGTPISFDPKTIIFRSYHGEWMIEGRMETLDHNKKATPVLQIYHQQKIFSRMSPKHGEFCSDEFFGWKSWMESSKMKNCQDSEKYASWKFAYQAEVISNENDSSDQPREYQQSFGECLSSRFDPRIFILSFGGASEKDFQIEELPIPSNICPSQICLMNDTKIVFVGIDISVRKSGLMYCYNKPSSIYTASLPNKEGGISEIKRLTDPAQVASVRMPIIDNDKIVRLHEM